MFIECVGLLKFLSVASLLPTLVSSDWIFILCSRSILAIAFISLHLVIYGYLKLKCPNCAHLIQYILLVFSIPVNCTSVSSVIEIKRTPIYCVASCQNRSFMHVICIISFNPGNNIEK